MNSDESQQDIYGEEGPGYGVTAWSWTSLETLQTPRELPRLRRLPNGEDIIIIGGGSELLSTSEETTEIFSQATRQWRPGPTFKHKHRDAEAVLLQDGGLLVIGGSEGPTKTGSVNVEVLPPGEDEWQPVSPLSEARIGHAACLLQDGRVLVTGGQRDPETFLDSCEIYDPAEGTWESTQPMSEVRATHHLRALPDGRAIAIGGGSDITATRSVEIFDAETGTWSGTDSMRDARWGFASSLPDGDNTIIVAGGRVPAQKGATISEDQMVILNGVEKYDIEAERWTSLAPMYTPRSMGIPNVELISLPSGGLMFPGGRAYPAPYHGTASTECFDPQTDSWLMLAPMRAGASYHAFITLDNSDILTAGGRGARFLPLRRTEIFEAPAAS